MKIAKELRHAVGSVSTKSFLNPLLWLCGLISIPSYILSSLTVGLLQIAFFAVGTAPLLLVIFLTLKYQNRPDLFQSEEYRLRDQALRIFGNSQSSDIDGLSKIVGVPKNYTLIEMDELNSEITK